MKRNSLLLQGMAKKPNKNYFHIIYRFLNLIVPSQSCQCIHSGKDSLRQKVVHLVSASVIYCLHTEFYLLGNVRKLMAYPSAPFLLCYK